jgi:hypothetical protein
MNTTTIKTREFLAKAHKERTFELLGFTLGNPKHEITYLSIESEKTTFDDYMDLQRLMRNL